MKESRSNLLPRFGLSRPLALTVLLSLVLVLAACGGTKVYDVSKTIVYNGSMYNVTDTKAFTTSIDGTLSDGSKVDLRTADRKKLDSLLDSNGPFDVTMAFSFDGDVMVYRQGRVSERREFDRMKSDFERAGDRIAKLMRAKKTEQLKL